MLHHRQDACRKQAVRCRAAEVRGCGGVAAIGAVADDAMAVGIGEIENGEAIDIDADRKQVMRHELRGEADDFRRALYAAGREIARG